MGGGINKLVDTAGKGGGIRELLDVKELKEIVPLLGRAGTLRFCEAALPVLKDAQAQYLSHSRQRTAQTYEVYVDIASRIIKEEMARPRIPGSPLDAEPRVLYDREGDGKTFLVVGEGHPDSYVIEIPSN